MKTASSLILSQTATRVVEVCKKPSLDTDSEVSHVPVMATFVQLFISQERVPIKQQKSDGCLQISNVGEILFE